MMVIVVNGDKSGWGDDGEDSKLVIVVGELMTVVGVGVMMGLGG